MTCTPAVEQSLSLRATTERVYCQAEHALERGDIGALDAVWWICTHLSASARVVQPALTAALPDGRQRVAALRVQYRSLVQVVWRLERRLTGDSRLNPLDPGRLVAQLRTLLQTTSRMEQDLLARLEQALAPADLAALTNRYATTIRHSPTRPHPLAPVGGRLAAWGFRLEGVIDHARDALDNRHAPLPRAVHTHQPGRWGQYLLGSVDLDESDHVAPD